MFTKLHKEIDKKNPWHYWKLEAAKDELCRLARAAGSNLLARMCEEAGVNVEIIVCRIG